MRTLKVALLLIASILLYCSPGVTATMHLTSIKTIHQITKGSSIPAGLASKNPGLIGHVVFDSDGIIGVVSLPEGDGQLTLRIFDRNFHFLGTVDFSKVELDYYNQQDIPGAMIQGHIETSEHGKYLSIHNLPMWDVNIHGITLFKKEGSSYIFVTHLRMSHPARPYYIDEQRGRIFAHPRQSHWGGLACISADDGSLLWTYELPLTDEPTLATISDFRGSHDGALLQFQYGFIPRKYLVNADLNRTHLENRLVFLDDGGKELGRATQIGEAGKCALSINGQWSLLTVDNHIFQYKLNPINLVNNFDVCQDDGMDSIRAVAVSNDGSLIAIWRGARFGRNYPKIQESLCLYDSKGSLLASHPINERLTLVNMQFSANDRELQLRLYTGSPYHMIRRKIEIEND